MSHAMNLNPNLSEKAFPDPEAAPASDEVPDLVVRARQGEVRAFEQLYRRHIDRIYGLCWRLCDGDARRADQAAQDCFVRAWEKLESFRGEAQFGTWLHRIAVNCVLGEHRWLRRWLRFEEEAAAAANLTAASESTRSDLRRDLEMALARLPRGARAVLVLHDIEGYTHDEIAALTGIAVGTSKAQLHRARKLMKEYLQ